TPYEVMLSESQERMLLVVKKGRVAAVTRLFAKWGLHAAEIGRVTDDHLMRVRDRGEVVAEIPVTALTSGAPVYRRPRTRPRYLKAVQRLPLRGIPQPRDAGEALLKLLASPTIADKARVYEQYDHMVRTNTVVLPGRADAAVLRIKGTDTLLAATLDGNGTACYLDPYEGGKLAVAEAARNLACVGATPLAVTDCLNFGNPEDPEIMWQFAECVRGISDACRVFGTPVTGGNVSLYNESPQGAIDPTPVIGMIGLIQAAGSKPQASSKEKGLQPAACSLQPITANFKDEGDVIILLGDTKEELGGSEYLKRIHNRKQGKPPRVDLRHERTLQRLLVDAIARGLIKSAHDCSEGGLAVTLAECCLMDPEHLIGATVHRPPSTVHRPQIRIDAWLFGESAGRVVVTGEPYHQDTIASLTRRAGVPYTVLGTVGGARLSILPWIELSVDELVQAWRTGLSKALEARG
ncbi:MAG: phosphoribosylformylglycinamidine synthase II, partial [Candidatus Omnitrophica bacterium]|nr:phosphoribosylformylglycinamidine synthase II [Candidatus Omnitrophota bacterium]